MAKAPKRGICKSIERVDQGGLRFTKDFSGNNPKIIGENQDRTFRSFAYMSKDSFLEDHKRAIITEYLDYKRDRSLGL